MLTGKLKLVNVCKPMRINLGPAASRAAFIYMLDTGCSRLCDACSIKTAQQADGKLRFHRQAARGLGRSQQPELIGGADNRGLKCHATESL